MFVPDSYKVTATSTSTIDYVQALESHFVNTSTKFSVPNTNDDTANSGDYGIEISPDDTGESWGAAVFYDSSNGDIRAFLDPNDSISNPIDPTSGSSATSPVNGSFLPDMSGVSYTPNAEFLVAELADVFVMMIKYSDDSAIEHHGHLGKVFQPVFTGDVSFGLDGLGVNGARLGFNNSNQTAYRVSSEGWENASHASNNSLDSNNPSLPDGRIRPRLQSVESNNSRQKLGTFRTYYHWTSNPSGLTRLEDSNGTGGLLFLTGSANVTVPWDPSVNPV